MEGMELKVGLKRWLFLLLVAFAALLIIATNIPVQSVQDLSIATRLLATLFISIVIVGTIAGVNSFFQRKITLNADELTIEGFSTKTIFYKDVEKVEIGGGGVTIHGNGHNVSISNLYKGFPEAIAFLRSKVDLQDVKIIWARKEIPESV